MAYHSIKNQLNSIKGYFRKAFAVGMAIALVVLVNFSPVVIYKAQAGVCGNLIALKNGVAQKETGAITIPAGDKSKWELRITTEHARKTCNGNHVKVTVQTLGLNNVMQSEEIVIPSQDISGGNNIDKTIALNVSNGTRTYQMISSASQNFQSSTINPLKITSNRTDTPLPPTNTGNNPPSNTPVRVVEPGQIDNPFAGKTLSGVVTQVINILLALIIIAAVVVIIIAGFRMIAGGGNPDQITKAKKTIVWAIIGLVVALMSFTIVRIVGSLL